MKVRKGFVSNSSSSSYIIAFDPIIDIKKLFKNKNRSGDPTEIPAIGAVNLFYEIRGWHWIDAEWEDDMLNFYKSQEQWDKDRGNGWHHILIKMRELSNKTKEGEEIAYIRISYGDKESMENLYNTKGIRILDRYGKEEREY